MGILRSFALDIWIFAGQSWLVQAVNNPYTEKEVRTIQVKPTIVARLEDHLDATGKIVGVSNDFERLAACEPVMRRVLGERASIARSQPYYLDVTPPATDKGTAVAEIAQQLGPRKARS
jgi:hydroxymethylpyrimidine pyrophosphatase-like HAD family hydrolase